MATKKKPVMLSKDDILGADDLPKELVEVPEWGGSVYVRQMSGAERDAFGVSCLPKKGAEEGDELLEVRAKLVARTVCDEDGNRLFTNAEVDDLGGKSSVVLERLFDVAARLNALTEKEVEELEGN